MHQTRGGHVQRPLTCAHSGWPVGPTFQPHMSFLGVTLSKRWWNGTQGLELVEAATHGRPAMCLGRQANTW
jgi:hypothetical protein